MRVGFFLGRFSALPARTRALNNAPATPHDAATARARTRTTTPHKKTKVACTPAQRGELRDLVCIFRASVIDVGRGTLTLEVTGREDKMRAMVDLLEPYGELGGVAGVGWGGRWGGVGVGSRGGSVGGAVRARGLERGLERGWKRLERGHAGPRAPKRNRRTPTTTTATQQPPPPTCQRRARDCAHGARRAAARERRRHALPGDAAEQHGEHLVAAGGQLA